jgi:hypothetical protein
MDHVVELELVDIAGVEPCEAGSHVLEELAQLRSVVRGDRLACGTALSLVHLLASGFFSPRHILDAISAEPNQLDVVADVPPIR